MDNLVEESIEKIAKECEEAGATKWDVTKIVKELSKEKEKGIEHLRNKTIELLEEMNPKAANVYISFHKLRVHTTDEKIEPFDRGNIIKSLTKETDVNRSVAENIGNEVENKIKDYKIKFLTTALIREMVNAKLLEYGYENVQNQYTRLGMPVFDVQKNIDKKTDWEETLREFNILKVIPREILKKHFENSIFIEDIAGFSTRAISYSMQPEEGNNVSETIIKTMKHAEKIQGLFKRKISIDQLNLFLSTKISKKKETKEATELCALAFPKNCVGNYLYVPEETEKQIEINKTHSNEIANHMLRLLREQETKTVVDSRFKLKLLKKNSFSDGMVVLNCSKERLFPHTGLLSSSSRGISSNIMINISKITKESENEEIFSEKLDEIAEAVKECGLERKKQIKERKLFKENNLSPAEFEECASLYGLENGTKFSRKKVIKKCFMNKGIRITESIVPEGIHRFEKENQKLTEIKTEIGTKEKEIEFEAESKKELYTKIKQGIPIIILKKNQSEQN